MTRSGFYLSDREASRRCGPPVRFSPKQMRALLWWTRPGDRERDAILCDGAVRSGKTLCLSLGFILWAMCSFQGQVFALCGKTVTALRRNLVIPLRAWLRDLGFGVTEVLSRSYLDVTLGRRRNRFYLFGGRDEGSASLIQGITLSGVLLDEAALMPRSFVEQALARCSGEGARFWFNCNPGSPRHWFYREWITKTEEKNALYLHFTMEDNPSLTQAVRDRYARLYSGVFRDRYILGLWTESAGLVYPMFGPRCILSEDELPEKYSRYAVSCDYGTVNPASFGLWGERDGVWYRLREYYYDSRREGSLRTDEEHYLALKTLVMDAPSPGPLEIICDPSAASFMETIRRHGKFRAVPAKNQVLSGIRRTAGLLQEGRLLFSSSCLDTIREFGLYRWADSGGDLPLKENDHAMDDIRYFVNTLLDSGDGRDFFAGSVSR